MAGLDPASEILLSGSGRLQDGGAGASRPSDEPESKLSAGSMPPDAAGLPPLNARILPPIVNGKR